MTLVIVSILIIGYVLISTGWMTNVNRAAVAVFMGTVGWVLYICYGTDFVLAQHPREYSDFLMGVAPNPENVKHFISQNIFLDALDLVGNHFLDFGKSRQLDDNDDDAGHHPQDIGKQKAENALWQRGDNSCQLWRRPDGDR